jgi:phosphoglycolate phosphatase
MNALFDLDGTLIDSRAGIVNAMRVALLRIGRSAPADSVLEQFIGPPTQETFHTLVGANDTDLVAKAIGIYRLEYSERGLYNAAIYPGILSALSMIRAQGWPLYVATSKPTAFALRIVEHFGLSRYFRGIFGSEFDGTRSNKAELIRHVMISECLLPADTIMIGDREQDIRGAKANSLRSIGALWGYGSHAELMEAGADVLCNTPPELQPELWVRAQHSASQKDAG